MNEAGVGDDLAEQLLELFKGNDRLGEPLAAFWSGCKIGELPLEPMLEIDRVGVSAPKIALELGIVQPAIEVVEVPLGQVAKRIAECAGCRCSGGSGIGNARARKAVRAHFSDHPGLSLSGTMQANRAGARLPATAGSTYPKENGDGNSAPARQRSG